ncbi:MAG TPA: arsenate reductase ArsC [Rhizomicrobium sp.]|nr:arsenate reductase ArsC [Rhizomicrobium sp.]
MRGPNGEELPQSVLFACTHNAIRSAMAEHIMRHLYGKVVYVDSAGARKGERDDFVTEVMDEIGLNLKKHRPKSFDDMEENSFDLVITLSPEAHHRAMELTRTSAAVVEYWPTHDPSLTEGSREQRLDAYRTTRDDLMRRIRARFAVDRASDA